MDQDYRWFRFALIALAIAAQLVVVAAYVDVLGAGHAPWYGRAGASIDANYSADRVRVSTVEPDAPAERAGLRAGDLIDTAGHSSLERWQWFFNGFPTPMNGTPVTLTVTRASHVQRMSITPDAWDLRKYWPIWLGPVGDFFVASIALLIAVRARATTRNLSLAAVLALLSLGEVTSSQNFALPSVALYVLLALAGTLVYAATVAWIWHAATFLKHRSRLFFAMASGAILLQAYIVAMTVAHAVAVTTMAFPMASPWFSFAAPQCTSVALAVACSIFAIAGTAPAERSRAAWSLCSLSLFFVLHNAADYVPASGFGYVSYYAELTAYNVISFIFPAILAYAALSRRIVDIGFVLNRAAVFTLVSAILVGAFVLLEYTVGTWLADATHTTGAIVGGAIALGLGLSLRFVHHHVDGFVDRVLFRKRHEDERALRNFAFEAAFMTDRATLLERTITVVERHTGTQKASILLPGVDISDNDPAILALRAWRKPVELHAVNATAIAGEYAIPMLARGSLVGVLVCAERSNHEAFAPDERAALQALAHGVALTLDTLADKNDDLVAAVRAEIRDMREAIVTELQAARGGMRSTGAG